MATARSPLVEVLELRTQFIKFRLRNTDVSMANALRRIMIAEVPTVCMDTVVFEDNTSSVQDEYLAHRLGLIPLRLQQPMANMVYNHECDCDGFCPACSVVFELDVDYDRDIRRMGEELQGMPITITSRYLKEGVHTEMDTGGGAGAMPAGGMAMAAVPVHTDEEEEPEHAMAATFQGAEAGDSSGIVIVRIGPGERLKLRAFAIKGIAKEHAKWSPVAVATYHFEPVVEVRDDLVLKLEPNRRRAVAGSCPVRVFDFDEETGRLIAAEPEKCMYCQECIYLLEEYRDDDEEELAVSVRPKEDSFTFSVETTGALHASEVVDAALETLLTKLRELKVGVQELQAQAPR